MSSSNVVYSVYGTDDDQVQVSPKKSIVSQNQFSREADEETVDEVTAEGAETDGVGEATTEAEEADNHQPMSYTAPTEVDDTKQQQNSDSDETAEGTESSYEMEGWTESDPAQEAGEEAEEALIEAYHADAEATENGQEFFAAFLPILKTILPSLAKTAVQTLAGSAANRFTARHKQLLSRLGRLGNTRSIARLAAGQKADMESDATAEFDAASLNEFDKAIEAMEVILGKDDRVQIKNTRTTPWNKICHLSIQTSTGKRYLGTGFIVGPRTIITAGHCVYFHSQGGWAKEIIVTPGRDGASVPFKSFKATSFRSVKGWVKNKSRNYDYGAIILPKNVMLPTTLGAFGFASLSSASLLNSKMNTAGYPGDKAAGTMWFHGDKVKSVTPRTIVYRADTMAGQSGSPVWVNRNGKRIVVGIHTNGDKRGNSSTRIVKPVFNNLKRWVNEGK
jgi:V8-like Glu-specific endopeptidase